MRFFYEWLSYFLWGAIIVMVLLPACRPNYAKTVKLFEVKLFENDVPVSLRVEGPCFKEDFAQRRGEWKA